MATLDGKDMNSETRQRLLKKTMTEEVDESEEDYLPIFYLFFYISFFFLPFFENAKLIQKMGKTITKEPTDLLWAMLPYLI